MSYWTHCLLVLCLVPPLLAEESPIDSASSLATIGTDFGLADGPAWDGAGVLYVPDVKGQKLFAWRPESQSWTIVIEDAGRISASFFRHGRLYLSDNGNAAIATLRDGERTAIREFPGEKPDRPNDLVVDRGGGIYVTLTAQNEVAYVTPNGDQSIAVSEIDSPNGITLSPDERTLYVAAYKPKQIWAFDLSAAGETSNRRLFATMDDGAALGADGMTIDSAGNVYCAGATDVWIWSPGGKLLAKIACPTRPINCAFGDADRQSLYIAGFGGVYRQRMRVAGLDPAR